MIVMMRPVMADYTLDFQRINKSTSAAAPNINCNRGEGAVNCGHGTGPDPTPCHHGTHKTGPQKKRGLAPPPVLLQ
jgi:hypothetical protein